MIKLLVAVALLASNAYAQSRSSGSSSSGSSGITGGSCSASQYMNSISVAGLPSCAQLSLDQITGAAGAVSWANGANAVTATADTIGAADAIGLSTSHTTFSGTLIKGTSSGNNATSTGSVFSAISTGASNKAKLFVGTSASTDSAARGIDLSMTGAGSNTGIALTMGNAASSVGFAVSRAGTAGSNNFNTITDASTTNSTGLQINMTGATGNQAALGTQVSTSGTPVGMNSSLTSASNIGTSMNSHNASTSGGAFFDGDIAVAGSSNGMRLYNKGTATNNNGIALNFFANRTGTTDTPTGRISSLITDITAGAYKGAVVISTSNNAAPTEHMRIDYIGHVIMTGTVAAATAGAGSCGTSPTVAGNDVVGRVTIGASPAGTTCTMTFAVTYTTAPVCTCTNETTAQACRAAATATTVVLTGVQLQSDVISFTCIGY